MNMAVDRALLQAYKVPVLRIYKWKPAGISLGYSQRAEQVLNLNVCAQNKIAIARRISGGEAVYHENDLSYSIVCARQDLKLPFSVKQSFKIMASFLIDLYCRFGIRVEFAEQKQYAGVNKKQEIDFCLSAVRGFDLVFKGKKIGGNAQKRTGKKIFQHGFIPITLNFPMIKSLFSISLDGIEEKTISLTQALKTELKFEYLAEMLRNSFARVFNVEFIFDDLNDVELHLAEQFKNLGTQ
ncbi:MAG: hypothetical protein DRP78_01255 [Candidatus Omnitrophota bacterium]|nr:MAG: hypothetical protein DRP78_01255 [Candidatus Omnitrophota bacterium]